MMLILIFSLWMWAGDEAYVVILKDGKRMEVKQAPVFEKGRAILELKNGDKVALPEKMVDMAASRALNLEMAKFREQEQRLAELKEAERQAAALAAAEARKPVIISVDELPQPETVTSVEADVANDDSVGLTDPAVPSEAATDTSEPAAAINTPPYAKSFASKEPVFVSAERRTRLPGGGYQVECDIKVNHVTGADNVVLSYKANFVKAAAEAHTIEVEPKTLNFNQTVTVRFTLKTDDDLFRTEHGIEAEIDP